jgi:hypothetical protein
VTTITSANLLANSGISPFPAAVPVDTNADKAIYLAFVAAESGTNVDTVQFKADIPFIGLTPNAPLKF